MWRVQFIQIVSLTVSARESMRSESRICLYIICARVGYHNRLWVGVMVILSEQLYQ